MIRTMVTGQLNHHTLSLLLSHLNIIYIENKHDEFYIF